MQAQSWEKKAKEYFENLSILQKVNEQLSAQLEHSATPTHLQQLYGKVAEMEEEFRKQQRVQDGRVRELEGRLREEERAKTELAKRLAESRSLARGD